MTSPSPSNSAPGSDPSPTVPSKRALSPTATDEPPSKRFKYVATITVLAGVKEQPFIVHEDEASAKSPFFASACSENWKEGRDRVVKVASIEPEVMEQYIQWIYKDQLCIKTAPASDWTKQVGTHLYWHNNAVYREHVELYLAAQYFLDDALKIRTIESLRAITKKSQGLHMTGNIEHVWETSSEDCGLQRLMVDTTLTWLADESVPIWLQKQCPDFVYAVAARVMLTRGKSMDAFDPRKVDKCYYHDHKEGEKCEPRATPE
ncbi:unnamed protein product [Zymoseptoria tritici ST99CH_3D7]|uniref:BTB domain-containing protein n=1 Tax=Zymoseptoria tritici (strain ST99CH_3D7) TaxID=1276538 RepID=A0A1X7S9N5_ZYMT9|nr:unnamed protein product [Zymoseptoria tritici ST99CH_3D7]